jgi:hypothetical protein
MKLARTLLLAPAVLLLSVSLFGQAANTRDNQASPSPGEIWNDKPMRTPYEELTHNPRLADKVQSLLPSGADLKQATTQFNYLDEFLAAVHVSNNLSIPLDQLKAKMRDSSFGQLRKAVETLKPDVDAKAEVNKAKDQGKQDVKDSKKKE